MSGLWAFWYALDSPERVSKIVQMGCPGIIIHFGVPFFMRLLCVQGVNAHRVACKTPNPEETLFLRFPVCRVHIREVVGSSPSAPIFPPFDHTSLNVKNSCQRWLGMILVCLHDQRPNGCEPCTKYERVNAGFSLMIASQNFVFQVLRNLETTYLLYVCLRHCCARSCLPRRDGRSASRTLGLSNG